MESIKELRKICQESRLWADTLHGRYICRPLSIYITRLVLFTSLTANHVTMIFFAAGVIASILFLSGSIGLNFLASLILQLWYLLDHVDGEVARYRNTTSLVGIFMDEMVHYIVHPLIFICIGIGQFLVNQNVIFIMLSIPASLAMILIPLVQVMREKVFQKNEPINNSKTESIVKQTSYGVRLFSILHSSCTFSIVMDIITIFSIVSLLAKYNLLPFILWYYAIVGTGIWVMKVIVIVMTGNKK